MRTTDRGGDGSTPYVLRGDTLSYKITAQNLFDTAVTFVFSDALSDLVKYAAGTLHVSGTNVADSYVSTSGFLEYTASSVAMNEFVTIAFEVTVTDGAKYDTRLRIRPSSRPMRPG